MSSSPITRSRSRSPAYQRYYNDVEENLTNLYVSGLSMRITEQDLERKFSTYGTVLGCQVLRDPHGGVSRGFAFLNMSTPEEANAAVSRLDKYEWEGKVITVELARRKRARTPTPGQYKGKSNTRMRRFGGGFSDRRYPPPGGYYGGGRYENYRPRDRDLTYRDYHMGHEGGAPREEYRGGSRYMGSSGPYFPPGGSMPLYDRSYGPGPLPISSAPLSGNPSFEPRDKYDPKYEPRDRYEPRYPEPRFQDGAPSSYHHPPPPIPQPASASDHFDRHSSSYPRGGRSRITPPPQYR